MFYNQSRTTKSQMKGSTLSMGGSKVVNPKERLINLQKREKLKGLLISKFMSKYGIKHPEKLLEDEISKFLQGDKLNATDLQRLEVKINKILLDKKAHEDLKNTLTQDIHQQQQQQQPLAQNDVPTQSLHHHHQPEIKESALPPIKTDECYAVHNTQPTVSRSSNTRNKGFQRKKLKSPEEELAELEAEEEAAKPHYERMDFTSDGDEWNAMAQYNKKMFEEEKINEKMKDWEIKRRTKEDLDNQVKQKLIREKENELKAKEYDGILLKHLEHLKELEKKKEEALKKQVLREKENRDVQMKDEYTRKKIETLKEKKYERELVKTLVEEIEKDNQSAIEKKQRENEALKRTLKDNELNKIKQLEALKKERQDDIRSCEEYAKTEEKRENERKQYFKNIERNSNNFMTNTVKHVLEDMEIQNKNEEEQMRKFNEEKNRREEEEEERKKMEVELNKTTMRNYLDMQVEEKKKTDAFEKLLDHEQARIWKVDTRNYYDQEKDIAQKILKMNRNNLDSVMAQIQKRRDRKGNPNTKMTETEYAMNRKALEKAKEKA